MYIYKIELSGLCDIGLLVILMEELILIINGCRILGRWLVVLKVFVVLIRVLFLLFDFLMVVCRVFLVI